MDVDEEAARPLTRRARDGSGGGVSGSGGVMSTRKRGAPLSSSRGGGGGGGGGTSGACAIDVFDDAGDEMGERDAERALAHASSFRAAATSRRCSGGSAPPTGVVCKRVSRAPAVFKLYARLQEESKWRVLRGRATSAELSVHRLWLFCRVHYRFSMLCVRLFLSQEMSMLEPHTLLVSTHTRR